MRLRRLHLLAYGAFTDCVLDFGESPNALIVVHGENEAGKSTTLNAITDLRFGFEKTSDANFLHPYSKLRIGGEFVDEAGERHCLIRRKGNNKTLMLADFDGDTSMSSQAAPIELERSLTQGFDRASYLRTFGLDRERMMQGGHELFRAGGDIGALLFEASTGTGSLSDITRQFEADARKLYSVSANARNSLINKALLQHRKLASAYAGARLLPGDWSRLNHAHEEAKERWNTLLRRQRMLIASRDELRELRLVLTQLKQLDNERSLLKQWESIPVLEESAEADFSGLQSGLKQLAAQASDARLIMEQQQLSLEFLDADDAILEIRQSVQRVVSSSETLSKRREQLSLAELDVETARSELASAARVIDAQRSVSELLALIPSRSTQADFNERLSNLQNSHAALTLHLQTGETTIDNNSDTVSALPAQAKRAAFDAARADVARHESDIQRLTLLPRLVQSARRAMQQILTDIGIENLDALDTVQVLNDSVIDEQVAWENRLQSTNAAMLEEQTSLEKELSDERLNQRALLDEGAIATIDDVQSARNQRDQQWHTLRSTCIDTTESDADDTKRQQLADRFHAALVEADRQADTLANDTNRAARVQNAQRMIEKRQNELAALNQRHEVLQLDDERRQQKWRALLVARSLPELGGASLREWQSRFRSAREQAELLRSMTDEQQALESMTQEWADTLRSAINALEMVDATPELPLNALISLADTVSENLRKREEALQEQAGRRAERSATLARRAEQEQTLRQAIVSAQQAAAPVFDHLLLPAASTADTARERLKEFIELEECQTALLSAELRRDSLTSELSSLLGAIDSIKEFLNLSEDTDPVLFCEQIETRLEAAERLRQQRADAQRRYDSAVSTRAAAENQSAVYRESIARLCQQAGVKSVEELPARIAESNRKRGASLRLEQALTRLSDSSSKDETSLRELLAGRDEEELEIEIEQRSQDLLEIDEQFGQARDQLAAAKHELDRCDGSATAALIANDMQQSLATIRLHLPTWIRLKLADTLLKDATSLFREKAQAPMFERASSYFRRITDGEFRVIGSADDGRGPTLLVTRSDGESVGVDGLSEGTRDQLYLSLRLAAVDLRRRGGVDLPLVLDDVLMSSDEKRTSLALAALAEHAVDNQVILLTHHRHVVELAKEQVPAERLVSLSL